MSLSWTTSLTPVRAHYEACLEKHGANFNGVGWKDWGAQEMRFRALLNLVPDHGEFSVNDWGCGNGDLRDWLHPDVTYYGYDISQKMLEVSRKGYAFNMLHDRADNKKPGLYYASPARVVGWIPSGQRVSVLQYYSPWDFTIIVNKC